MAQHSEKRFHHIMDKLFSSAPKSPPSSSTSSPGEQTSRGKKRPNPSSILALVEPKMGLDIIDKSSHMTGTAGPSQAPLCRPWVRGDLMKRLATFKSMTWFAKPQVISAVSCARRGWLNVDMDTIACECCGVRLLFSTPSSWSQQQVEKAASVFSLKLDSAHKLLCPWIDNSCDETLAEFPSMTPQDLVDRFQERSSALLQLLALPVISPSAIEYMRSSELEEFLHQPIKPAHCNVAAEFSEPETLGNDYEASSAQLYYQAQKLISLCGWEPRTLPYIVYCKEKPGDSISSQDTISLLSKASKGKHLSISAQSPGSNEILANSDKLQTRDSLNSDPNSVVLDCKICGAITGLWVFSVVPRPLELCRVTGYTDINAEKNSSGSDLGNFTLPNQRAIFSEQTSSLNFTIAGGPPATKQSFKATISLPIIGRNLRSRFASVTRDHTCGVHDHSVSMGGEHVSQPENSGLSENTNDNQGHDSSIGDQQPETTQNSDDLTKESNLAMGASEGRVSESGRNDSGIQEKVDAQMKYTAAGKNVRQSAILSKQMEFDPIKQHRHFCPWIASSGKRGPGWRQTLSALQPQKDSSQLSPSATSSIMVGDPISSVRNLFTSPSAKRPKPNTACWS